MMDMLPIENAITIYNTIADRREPKGARERLSEHLWKIYLGGEHDPHRLTMHGLSYLQGLDRAYDSRDKYNN